MDKLIGKAFFGAGEKYWKLSEEMRFKSGRLPHSMDHEGKLKDVSPASWVSGFFPGSLWYLYEENRQNDFKKNAALFTSYLESQKNNHTTHDIGFMMFCSYGNQLRLTGDSTNSNDKINDILLTSARTLLKRFNSRVGCILSWDPGKKNEWRFPVIIDNMMNLELLMWAFKETGDSTFYHVAVTHANTTRKHHFRPDYSSYHVISYNPDTGVPELKETHQGYSHESAWSRGQAWGLYGYTMMYRETADKNYLALANNIAHFIINHPNLPEDKIPYWDFDAPNIPNECRDASAGAIICSALIELSQYVDAELSEKYLDVAEKQIRSLSSPAYTIPQAERGNFILAHSVGYLPGNTEIDVSLSYADYYYLEALLRYKKLLK